MLPTRGTVTKTADFCLQPEPGGNDRQTGGGDSRLAKKVGHRLGYMAVLGCFYGHFWRFFFDFVCRLAANFGHSHQNEHHYWGEEDALSSLNLLMMLVWKSSVVFHPLVCADTPLAATCFGP